MLSLAVLAPLAGILFLALAPTASERAARIIALVTALMPVGLMAVVWAGFDTGAQAPAFQFREEVPWIPALGVAWRMGVDGISLPLAAMSALVFLAAIAWPAETEGRPRQYYGWLLFLEAVSLGLFLTLDLLLFYVFFDLSLVGMYFLIGRWGHDGADGTAAAAALKFFVYTLAGSLALLLAILGLVLTGGPLTFDMAELIAQQPLGEGGLRAGLVLLGFLVGFAVKTPLVPVHTWLPPAHVRAPGPASAILAGVLLKMGTYGIIRIPLQMMPDAFGRHTLTIGILALVSIIWGALVALAQRDLKARIAYTSINHMGYTVLGIAVAGATFGDAAARQLALTGAVTEMVAHGFITGALFLIAGGFWQRARTYDLGAYGGLAGVAPWLTGATVLAAFASFGLPALAGFVAEFQIFAGTFAVYPWLAALGVIGIVLTAALFLGMVQELFFGARPERLDEFSDLTRSEKAALGLLLVFVVAIGVYPRWFLAVVDATTGTIAGSP